MKHVFTIVNAMLISMALGASHMYAENSSPWDGSVKMPDFNGQIYTIRTAEELAWVAQESRTDDFAGKVIRLEADIDLGGAQETPVSWTPIGSADKPFNGDFNGNNHVIYNLYILSSLLPQGAGLFAETGESAVIHHLGLGQGQIMTDAASNVGSFAGTNRGTIHHCFNMLQLIAHAGNNVGGLTGVNYGEIRYCYNAGIITDANSLVGGLVGDNKVSAIIDNCYNMGYCKGSDHVGALFGRNEAPESQLTKVYFDQQLTRIYATGDGANDKILKDNTVYAIDKSSVFIDKTSPFYEDPEVEWHYESAGTWSHPQLLCFKDHPASHVSVKSIWLDAENRPIERAEGVGTPIEGNEPRKIFKLESMSHSKYGKGEWFSPSPDVIYIEKPTSSLAVVNRPCGNQEVILTLSYDRFIKQIYTIVKGFDTFDAGIAAGHVYACWKEEGVGFKSNNKDGKEASGGRDDEQKNERLSYQYRIFRDTVIREGENVTYLPLDATGTMSQEAYSAWTMPTDVPGEYAFRREVHDTQCKTEWTPTQGVLFLTVRKEFDPGELVEKPDTIYAVLPQTLTIESYRDASGGGEEFRYNWMLTRSEWNADSLQWFPVEEDTRNPLYIDGELVDAPSFDYTFTQPGTYSFTRRVKEESCTTVPMESKRPHIVVVYEAINPGSIESFDLSLCSPLCTDTIQETESASKGDGQYTYRWLCNGEPLPDSDTTFLSLEEIPMESGKTYVFTRQVQDGTGLSGWVSSHGQVTVSIYGAFQAGSIESADEQVCTAAAVPKEINAHIREAEPAHGEEGSEFIYCWLLYKGNTDGKPIDTIRHNRPELDMTVSLSSYPLNNIPVTLYIRRAVKNAQCPGEWQLSENSASWRFGQSEEQTIPVTVCAAEMPYDYLYTFADGHTESCRFTMDGQRYTLTDETEEGCPMVVTLVSEVIPLPVVEVEPVVSVCQTASHLRIAFTVLSGEPDRFDLTFAQSAKEAGFRDSIGAFLPDSNEIAIPLPPFLPLGPQYLTMVFYTGDSVPDGCKRSAPQTLSFSIDLDGYVKRKGEDILFVDNSGRHTAEGLTFTAYRWYRNGEVLSGETGQFYYAYPSLDGVYQVEMITEDGTVYRSCLYEMRPTQEVDNPAYDARCRKTVKDGRLYLIYDSQMFDILGRKIQNE